MGTHDDGGRFLRGERLRLQKVRDEHGPSEPIRRGSDPASRWKFSQDVEERRQAEVRSAHTIVLEDLHDLAVDDDFAANIQLSSTVDDDFVWNIHLSNVLPQISL